MSRRFDVQTSSQYELLGDDICMHCELARAIVPSLVSLESLCAHAWVVHELCEGHITKLERASWLNTRETAPPVFTDRKLPH